jgi:aryl-alcohol dehydrogenase-like predicted oxidoreductase
LFSRGETSALNRKDIIEAVKESLANFNLGYIDLVLIHKTDPHCPIEGKEKEKEKEKEIRKENER